MDGEDVLLRSPIVGDWMLEGAAMTQLEAALRLAFDDEGARVYKLKFGTLSPPSSCTQHTTVHNWCSGIFATTKARDDGWPTTRVSGDVLSQSTRLSRSRSEDKERARWLCFEGLSTW